MKLSDEILVSEKAIRDKVSEMGKRINDDYGGKEPILIAVLNGAYMFTADMTRKFTFRYSLDFIRLQTTDGNRTGSVKKIMSFIESPLKGRDVILIDDIVDSGATLEFLKRFVQKQGAGSVKTCVMVLKETAEKRYSVEIDYSGFNLPEKWLVGYGMDYNGMYRGLPYIGFVE